MDAIQELKTRAGILRRRVQAQDPAALARVARHADLRGGAFQRRHALTLMAREFGFTGWPHALHILAGDGVVADFGTTLFPARCAAHTNLWFKNYAEAARVREEKSEYLLAYRQHFAVVDGYFLESLGLDPADPDWAALGYDWVRPESLEARHRLYAKLFASWPREAA